MNRQLIFIHGRSQDGKDSVALKKEWVQAWTEGLVKSGLKVPIAEDQIRFPYYGDTLDQMARGVNADEAARIVVRGQKLDRHKEIFMREYMQEIQEKAGISDSEVAAIVTPEVKEKGILNWDWVQGILSVLDRKVPGASAASVALFTSDVYQYLTNPIMRTTIDDGVRSAFKRDVESIVVSHSLGTVVAYNVLRDESITSRGKIPLFVTLGSPLAVTVVKKQIRPIAFPKCASHWFNAMDKRDVVALFPLDAKNFNVNPAIQNKIDVDNLTENRHGISGYLDDEQVARKIYEALIAPML